MLKENASVFDLKGIRQLVRPCINVYSIYKSFTGVWWIFIPSFFVMFAIHRANKKGTSQNLLDEAHSDKDFYERVRKGKLWQYEISEEDAKKYKIKK